MIICDIDKINVKYIIIQIKTINFVKNYCWKNYKIIRFS